MSNEKYIPPYTVTDKTISLVAQIGELIGSLSAKNGLDINPRLRRDNRIRTIHASLSIENNSLSLTQVTDVINGKHVFGAPDEIREVKNAYEAYNLLLTFNPYSITNLLAAHKILMMDLTKETGVLRSGGVGVFTGNQLVHMAPPENLVPELLKNLFTWIKTTDVHPLIKSCVFHYEFEFIHPFADGNGRMGRMWQTLILYKWKPIFAWLPVETIIRKQQQEYYDTLGACDKKSDSSAFIEFLLNAIYDTLMELISTDQVSVQVTDQVEKLLAALENNELTLKELMMKLNLKHRPSFSKNYLLPALELELIEMTIPDKPTSKNQKYRIKR